MSSERFAPQSVVRLPRITELDTNPKDPLPSSSSHEQIQPSPESTARWQRADLSSSSSQVAYPPKQPVNGHVNGNSTYTTRSNNTRPTPYGSNLAPPESSRSAHEAHQRDRNGHDYSPNEERASHHYSVSGSHPSLQTSAPPTQPQPHPQNPPQSYGSYRPMPEPLQTPPSTRTQPHGPAPMTMPQAMQYTYPAPQMQPQAPYGYLRQTSPPPPPPLHVPSANAHPQHYPPPVGHQQQLGPPTQATTYTHAPIIPTALDVTQPQDKTMEEIVRHCNTLYAFASRYADLRQSIPSIQPPRDELAAMAKLATLVVTLLDTLRQTEAANRSEPPRPKLKRPREDPAGEVETSSAVQDMETIRSKRAATIAVAISPPAPSTTEPKTKYRKRSSGARATPPGKCHSCNIRETPEWRRGPDGARTLCNACGIYYAKLTRQREKAGGGVVDIESLRAVGRPAPKDKNPKPTSRPTSTRPPVAEDTPDGSEAQAQAHHQDTSSYQPVPPPPPPPQQQQQTYVYYTGPEAAPSGNAHPHEGGSSSQGSRP